MSFKMKKIKKKLKIVQIGFVKKRHKKTLITGSAQTFLNSKPQVKNGTNVQYISIYTNILANNMPNTDTVNDILTRIRTQLFASNTVEKSIGQIVVVI